MVFSWWPRLSMPWPTLCFPGETGVLVPPARPQLLAEAIRYLIDSHPRPLAWLRQPVPVFGTRLTEAALRGALLAAYAAGAVPLPGDHPTGLASPPACCPYGQFSPRYGIVIKGSIGEAGVQWDSCDYSWSG